MFKSLTDIRITASWEEAVFLFKNKNYTLLDEEYDAVFENFKELCTKVLTTQSQIKIQLGWNKQARVRALIMLEEAFHKRPPLTTSLFLDDLT